MKKASNKSTEVENQTYSLWVMFVAILFIAILAVSCKKSADLAPPTPPPIQNVPKTSINAVLFQNGYLYPDSYYVSGNIRKSIDSGGSVTDTIQFPATFYLHSHPTKPYATETMADEEIEWHQISPNPIEGGGFFFQCVHDTSFTFTRSF